MQFKSNAQKDCYEKASAWLNDKFPGIIGTAEDLPAFFITRGSAILQVAVFPFGNSDSMIQCRAYVVSGVELTPDLLRYLLQLNTQLLFGSFGIDGDGDIILEYTCIGSSADGSSIQTISDLIVASANKYGDEIVARWGGQRAKEPEIP